jgi:hypothetical protein
MICSAKLLLTEDLCEMQKEEFSIAWDMYEIYPWRKAKDIYKRKRIFSSERLLHKDC